MNLVGMHYTHNLLCMKWQLPCWFCVPLSSLLADSALLYTTDVLGEVGTKHLWQNDFKHPQVFAFFGPIGYTYSPSLAELFDSICICNFLWLGRLTSCWLPTQFNGWSLMHRFAIYQNSLSLYESCSDIRMFATFNKVYSSFILFFLYILYMGLVCTLLQHTESIFCSPTSQDWLQSGEVIILIEQSEQLKWFWPMAVQKTCTQTNIRACLEA